ncbi:MAG TPA: PA2169 family four-helix-bundle protein [Chitinophagaceae bacterium]|nr:PA2169 family four-helix-bundle protein [Chitinophagaceae bacterium]
METNTEVLNDLIKINNDRIKGYEKAAKETADKDSDLRQLFTNMAAESVRYAQELKNLTVGKGPTPAEETTLDGDIYRAWMDVKATFSGKNRKAILASCEFGEDAAQKAYEKALKKPGLSSDVSQLVEEQKGQLKMAHDKIKRMRDTQPA